MKMHYKKKIAILVITALAGCGSILLGMRCAVAVNSVGLIVPTGDMTVARFDHVATLLSNGQVLFVGGLERNGVT
ncbi:MAG: hypothetical protein M3N14_00145 [Bacteroidota bacterium]|nr:hypothetical protein [Bacteroidota bacterium]